MLLFLKKMATRVFPGYAGSRRPFSSLVKSIELPELQTIDSVMVAQRPELIAAALKPSVTRLRSELPPDRSHCPVPALFARQAASMARARCR